MVAPTPVSALLHAVAVVKAGVFTILKVAVYVFGLDLLATLNVVPILAWVAAVTILVGSAVAFKKDNLKARLAYSTVSQLSYVVLGALLANDAAVTGAGMHIVMHAFGKITLFFAAGAVLVVTHEADVSRMRGLGRTMPVTFGAFFVAALSIIGLPPAGGVWSKWYLGLGTIEAGQIGLLAVLMLSSLMSLVYLLEVPVRAFFSAPVDDPYPAQSSFPIGATIREAPLPSLLAILVTASATVLLFLAPGPLYELMRMVAR
jgi:multicomponent Na+:H+ antiporter subunit D